MEKRKRRRSKRRLFILALALLFTAALFTTSTYAWFTANKTVKIEQLKVNVEAQNGIQISADGTNWKTLIQTQDFKNVRTTTYQSVVNQIPTSMSPVSTIGTVDDNGQMEMFYGTVGSDTNGNSILTAAKETDQDADSGKYIAVDVFFKVDGEEDVYITSASGVNAYAATGTPLDKGIKNAARIAFVNLGHTNSGDTTGNIQGLGIGAGLTRSTTIWEPNYNTHTDSAVGQARDVYGATVTADDQNEALAYSGVKAAITADDHVLLNVTSPTQYTTRNADFFSTVNPQLKTVTDFSEQFLAFHLQAGITKFRIYMWVEGQDVDCENNASGDDISFDFQFTTTTS